MKFKSHLFPDKNLSMFFHKLIMYLIFSFRSDFENDGRNQIVVDVAEMDRMKQDIMSELKKEMNKMKQDIIDGLLYFRHYLFYCMAHNLLC